MQSRKKIGVALGGGFVRSLASIGVLEVLIEEGIPIDMVAGCSAGGGVAAVYAAGTLESLKQRMLTVNRRAYWQVLFEPTLPRAGFLRGERGRKFFGEFVGEKTFADLQTPLALVATDVQNLKEVVLREGDVSRAIHACTAVPGIFVPVRWDQHLLVDGGNFNMLPTKPLYADGMEYVIAVDTSQPPNKFTRFLSKLKQLLNVQPVVELGLNARPVEAPKDLNIFQVISRAVHLSSTHIKNFHHSSYPYQILIRPDLVGIGRLHVGKAQYMINQGRAAALAALPQIKADLGL